MIAGQVLNTCLGDG